MTYTIKCVAGLFIDLQKVFDLVHIPMLLRKLEALDVGGNVLDIFTSYLPNRKQSVQVNLKAMQST